MINNNLNLGPLTFLYPLQFMVLVSSIEKPLLLHKVKFKTIFWSTSHKRFL